MTSDEAPDPVDLLTVDQPVFLMGQTFTRTVMTKSQGDPPKWRVLVSVKGKWNHGAEDVTLLMFNPDNSVAIGTALIGAAMSIADKLDPDTSLSVREELAKFSTLVESLTAAMIESLPSEGTEDAPPPQ